MEDRKGRFPPATFIFNSPTLLMIQKIREKKHLFTFLVIFVLALWFADAIFTVQHESAHREICKAFGGDNVTAHTNYSFLFTGGRTFCSNTTSTEGMKLQMQTDIIGYHVEALMMAFFFGVFLVVAYLELRDQT
ncbi:hypothetical protein AKJ36_00130 [candidate division MSBL1 archaeon SCGC-AAA259I07]|uniref:Uncharacterized protein n=1 Tax=candidate division MSBL1 archaeon SCGC-AAA259I07 TaxID=1698266 RepID=A0A133UMW4_9EURY|nr:hypothetical protein AKJ36_00130 [candidate division MSBL1 archaeon SCGC-AAA259I07]